MKKNQTHNLLPAEQLQERITVYRDLRPQPSPIPLCAIIKEGTLPLHLVVPNALQSQLVPFLLQ